MHQFLVWIHGGGYTSGAGQWPVYEPVSLLAVSPEIIVVNINYRLGVLGFLTTGWSNNFLPCAERSSTVGESPLVIHPSAHTVH